MTDLGVKFGEPPPVRLGDDDVDEHRDPDRLHEGLRAVHQHAVDAQRVNQEAVRVLVRVLDVDRHEEDGLAGVQVSPEGRRRAGGVALGDEVVARRDALDPVGAVVVDDFAAPARGA